MEQKNKSIGLLRKLGFLLSIWSSTDLRSNLALKERNKSWYWLVLSCRKFKTLLPSWLKKRRYSDMKLLSNWPAKIKIKKKRKETGIYYNHLSLPTLGVKSGVHVAVWYHLELLSQLLKTIWLFFKSDDQRPRSLEVKRNCQENMYTMFLDLRNNSPLLFSS